jgi:hypothetical protein
MGYLSGGTVMCLWRMEELRVMKNIKKITINKLKKGFDKKKKF